MHHVRVYAFLLASTTFTSSRTASVVVIQYLTFCSKSAVLVHTRFKSTSVHSRVILGCDLTAGQVL